MKVSMKFCYPLYLPRLIADIMNRILTVPRARTVGCQDDFWVPVTRTQRVSRSQFPSTIVSTTCSRARRELRTRAPRRRTKTNICPTVMRYIFRCKQRRYDSNSCRKRRVSRERVRRKINVSANRPVNRGMQLMRKEIACTLTSDRGELLSSFVKFNSSRYNYASLYFAIGHIVFNQVKRLLYILFAINW